MTFVTDPVIEVKGAALRGAFGRVPLRFRHRIPADDPELTLEALAAFAATLPVAWARIGNGTAPDLCDEREPVTTSPAGAISALGTNALTVRLYHLELHPERKAFVNAILDEADAVLGALEGGSTGRSCGAFLASPGAVTPWHPDRHHNLLLQVRGTKRLSVGAFPDPVEAQAQLERTFRSFGAGPSVVPPAVTTYQLGPGDGIYLPPYMQHHAVVTGGSVSVALSCGWSTVDTERNALVHAFNAAWRQRTGRPARPPKGDRVDRVKAATMRARFAATRTPARP